MTFDEDEFFAHAEAQLRHPSLSGIPNYEAMTEEELETLIRDLTETLRNEPGGGGAHRQTSQKGMDAMNMYLGAKGALMKKRGAHGPN